MFSLSMVLVTGFRINEKLSTFKEAEDEKRNETVAVE